MVQAIIRILSLLTLASNIGIVLFLIYMVFRKYRGKIKKAEELFTFLSQKALSLSFIVALTATSGSLFLSEIAKFQPCVFCWYQRIFMYPLVFILGTAIIKKIKIVWQFVLPLSITGLLMAAYNYYLQISPNPLVPCSAVGFSVSCSQRFFTYFGYITIPWMSLSAFTLITIGMFLLKLQKRNS